MISTLDKLSIKIYQIEMWLDRHGDFTKATTTKQINDIIRAESALAKLMIQFSQVKQAKVAA